MIVHGYRSTPNTLVLSRSGPMGERCMKDTVHPPVHPSVHPTARTSVTTTSPCSSSDTHFGHGQNTGLGWNDPGLAAFPRPKNLRGRSSPVFCPWLSLHIDRNDAGDRVLGVKTVKNTFCTLGASTSSPSVQISTGFSRNSRDCMCETPRAQNPQIGRERPSIKRVAPAQVDVPSAAVAVKDLATLDRYAARTHRASLTAILATGPVPS